MSRIPTRDLRKSEPFNAFFFTPAIARRDGQGRGQGQGQGISLSTLFSTHPPLEQRLAQLAELEVQLGQAR
jgi:heat shock protein HtpX